CMCAKAGRTGGGSLRAARWSISPMSGAPVDGSADQGVVLRHLEEALRVAQEQELSGTLQPRDSREQVALRLLVEVDDHVATENGLQWSFHRQRMHQVELLERDQGSDFGGHLKIRPVAFLTLREEPRNPLRAQ